MKVPLLDLKAQYASIRDEVRRITDEVCDSQQFILGPHVDFSGRSGHRRRNSVAAGVG